MAKQRTQTDQMAAALIEVPLLKTAGYVPTLVETRLTAQQAEALKSITHGLILQGARLADSHMVRDGATAVQWMLEQVK